MSKKHDNRMSKKMFVNKIYGLKQHFAKNDVKKILQNLVK